MDRLGRDVHEQRNPPEQPDALRQRAIARRRLSAPRTRLRRVPSCICSRRFAGVARRCQRRPSPALTRLRHRAGRCRCSFSRLACRCPERCQSAASRPKFRALGAATIRRSTPWPPDAWRQDGDARFAQGSLGRPRVDQPRVHLRPEALRIRQHAGNPEIRRRQPDGLGAARLDRPAAQGSLLAGKPVSVAATTPYGCSIKY